MPLIDQQQFVDQQRIKNAVNELLLAIGEDPGREGLLETPRRIAEMYAEVFSGMHTDPMEHLKVMCVRRHWFLMSTRSLAAA